MEVFELQISQSLILKILLYGVILFALLRLISRLLLLPRVKKILDHRVNRAFPFIEAFIWTLFLIWASQQLFAGKPVYTVVLTGAILLIVVWASWFAIRDVVAGIILKAEDAYEVNQWIKVKEIEGRIKKLGYRSLYIEAEGGQTLRLPYGEIAGEQRILSDLRETSRSHAFSLEMPKTLSIEETAERLRRRLLNSPWSSPKRDPRVKYLGESGDFYRFEVVAYTLGEDFSRKVEDYVKQQGENSQG